MACRDPFWPKRLPPVAREQVARSGRLGRGAWLVVVAAGTHVAARVALIGLHGFKLGADRDRARLSDIRQIRVLLE